MKRSLLRCMALALVIAAAMLVAPAAQADIYFEGTQTINLPASVPQSFYVEVLGHGTNTPTLTDGYITLDYSVIGDAGDLVAEAGSDCPPDRPDPVIRLVLTGARGTVGASATIGGTTTDPQTGESEPYELLLPDPPAVAEATTDDTQILRVCTGSEDAPANSAPEAGFGSHCSDLSCNFTDTSTDPDGSVTTWKWDFGDGTGSSEQHPTHTYSTPGSYDVTLTTADERGASDETTTTVSVYAPLVITTSELPEGKKTNVYAFTLEAAGGASPYSWAVVSGSLPPGLSFSTSGEIDGRPKEVGTYGFAVEVRDGSASPRTAVKGLSITITSPSRKR